MIWRFVSGWSCAAVFAAQLLIAAGSPLHASPQASPQPQPPQQAQQPSSPPPPDEYVGDDACTTCHTDQTLKGTQHGRASNPRTPAAQHGCETCHGPGKAHVDDDAKKHINRFPSMAPRDVNATCLTCHNRGEHALWGGSAHDARNLSCITCHSVHTPQSERGQLVKASQIELCATCHKQPSMKMRRASHMPVREGKMECTSCHSPHGSTNVRLLRAGSWINESCVSCHAEKRGPFLWEHAAGRESCVSCHDPHGSSNDRLLVAKLPMLCQRCHIGTRHPSTIYDGVQLNARSNRLVGRACINCHQNIHGSNHPSGNWFTR